MKNILLPISFSETSKNALHYAHLMALQHGATLSLMHCYSTLHYNREYDFGTLNYDEGIRKMLEDFYRKNIDSSKRQAIKLLAYEGSVSDNIREISHKYELLILSRRTGNLSKSNIKHSDKLFYLTTKSPCPVLLLPSKRDHFSVADFKNIWHIQREADEVDLINEELLDLKIDSNLVTTKALQQESFTSAFWQNIVNFLKKPHNAQLNKISESFENEHIDLLILVNHRTGMFENFLNDNIFQIISQFDTPILVLQSKK